MRKNQKRRLFWKSSQTKCVVLETTAGEIQLKYFEENDQPCKMLLGEHEEGLRTDIDGYC